MTREEAYEILHHWDDTAWLEYNGITCGKMFDALRNAENALSEPPQEQLIDKACRWLVEHTHDAATLGNITCTSVMTEGTLIEDFRKAMETLKEPLNTTKQSAVSE